MIINGVDVIADDKIFDRDELELYVDYVQDRVPNLARLRVSLFGGGKVKLDYTAINQKFERIRRVTGYLVGSLDRWNDAKRAEERDRVKHVGGKS